MLPEVRVEILKSIGTLSITTPTRESNELYLGLVKALEDSAPSRESPEVLKHLEDLRREVAELKKHVGVLMRDRAYSAIGKELA